MIIRLEIVFVLAAALVLSGCNPGISGGSQEASAGSADFSRFVAIGDSLTAGYADGALYRDIQLNSLALIMAQQFALAGGGELRQPLMPTGATGSINFDGTDKDRADRTVLAATNDPDDPLEPATITPVQSTDIQVRVNGAGMFNNMGIPGMKSFHMTAPGYGELTQGAVGVTSSPYFARFASSNTTTVVADIVAQTPSFFLFWVGSNDVLLYAIDGGGTQNAIPPYGLRTDDITDPDNPMTGFTVAYNGALAAVKTPTNKGILVNIPDIAALPFFTRVPHNPVPLTQAQVDAATLAYAPYNALVQTRVGLAPGPSPGGACGITQEEADRRMINFVAGEGNALVIMDESLTDITSCFVPVINMRQATAADFILLSSSSKIGTEAIMGDPTSIWGVGTPMADADVLVPVEIGYIETARTAYNATIKAAADSDPDLVLFDASAALTRLNDEGYNYGSGSVTSTFATGGFYSLDGIHPTARGYSIVANELFQVINAGFDAFIPQVEPNEYPTAPIK